ncbi:MAG: peptide chain release factor N(5)-glutamine methyltransferase [Sphingomonadaceae bacterium]|nr:peptide chain release factor N(5)-glutamine methyltransferase [Sphingomonadaceae bacterium]MCP5384054.1 peptide chain release factor N(5)-glutamine methyltransferase [Altererythrobacter sp.]MCP5391776.1 peptide chain release factor N(5)-glutamine methyltransferase [Sphingomonadaceae bacterium]MCP5393064.1 peptide chain release factor N(5)-glutamine methyltransferase [Sphingomonadaceae bacterium]
MTVSQAIREATERLSATSSTARLDAELLMAHALGVSRSDMLLRGSDMAVPPDFDALVERRIAREPVAYILGEQEFYGRGFRVTSDVLIPRGDSETVIEAALDRMGPTGSVLDLGTGSGALLLTLLAERPGWRGVGVDRSQGALDIAADNAQRFGLAGRAQMRLSDWTRREWRDGLGQFDMVISNPPYVESDAELEEDVRGYEPTGALFAGRDGLDDYRRLVPQLRSLLKPEGFAVLEIGHRQDAAVSVLALEHGFTPHLRRDLANRPRALILT